MRTKAIGATSLFLITNVAAIVFGIACSAPPSAPFNDGPAGSTAKVDSGNPPPTSLPPTNPGPGGDAGPSTSGPGAAKGAECKAKGTAAAPDGCFECCEQAFPQAFQAGTAKFFGLVCATCQSQCASTACANPQKDPDATCGACMDPHAEDWSKQAEAVDNGDPETVGQIACMNACPSNGGNSSGGSGDPDGGIEEEEENEAPEP